MKNKRKEDYQLSVVLPIFEEETTIQETIGEIHQRLDEKGLRFEIIAVDDGSEDGTRSVLEGLKSAYPSHLTVILVKSNYIRSDILINDKNHFVISKNG